MPAKLQVTRNNQTLILTLANADGLQALDSTLVADGIRQLKAIERDDAIRVVILTGTETDFCRGRDRSTLYAKGNDIGSALDQLNALVETIRNFPKPVIAAVEGSAHDAGLAIALACDYIIAGNAAQFSTGQIKLGLPPEGGISWMLSRQLPRQLVTELLLEGKPALAARLQMLGLVNQVVAAGSALDSALRYAQKLAEMPPLALERVKSLLNEAQGNSLSQQFEAERHAFLECLHHHEAREGVDAYLSQRKPRF